MTISTFLRRLSRHGLALLGLGIFLAAVLLSLAAPWVAPYDPLAAFDGLRLAPPGTPGHLLGLDNQGRDITSRLIWGGRTILAASVLPIVFAALVSLALGLLAGFRASAFSELIMRTMDMLFAFPMVLLAIGLSAVLGSGYPTLIITLICSVIPYLTRVVYRDTRTEVAKEYVEALRAQGASNRDILFREILPPRCWCTPPRCSAAWWCSSPG